MAGWLLFICAALHGTAVLAAQGDLHYVKGTNVNIRSGPSTETEVVARLNSGHRLTEIGRNGRWIQVNLGSGQDGTGWIREDLVTAKPVARAPEAASVAPPSEAQLSTTEGVIAALKAAPQDRVRNGFRAAIVAAGQICERSIGAPKQLLAAPEGVYYLVTCENDLKYSIQVKPDGRMGTEVVSCDKLLRVTGSDICSGKP